MCQLHLRFLQRFFGPLAIGAIYDDRRKERGVASTCGDKDKADVGPYYPAIFAQVALFDTINSSLPFVSVLNTGFGGGTILFVGDVRKRYVS